MVIYLLHEFEAHMQNKNYCTNIYIFKIRKLQSCRVPGGSDCSHFRTSLQPKFNFTFGGGGLTAVTSELHCSQSSTSLLGGPTAVSSESSELHCSQSSTLLLGGGPTAVTSELHCSQSSTSLWGGLTAVTSELHCSQSSTSLLGGGGPTAVTSELHCSQTSTSLLGGSDCSHFRTSLQPNFNFTWGGPTAVTSELYCRQTSTSLPGGVQNTEISVPLSHSVRINSLKILILGITV